MGMATDPGPAAGLRRDQSAPDRVAREIHAIAHLELLEDVRAVAIDRLAADYEHARDLVAGVPLGDELDDLDLARRQRVERLSVPAPGAIQIVTHQRADGSGVEEGLAAHRRAAG